MSNFLPADIPGDKPEQVVLHGVGERVEAYVELLAAAGIKVLGRHDGDHCDASWSALNDLDVRRRPEIPLVILSGGLGRPSVAPTPNDTDGAFAFKNALARLRSRGLVNRLLHPSFAVEFLNLPRRNAVFVAGPPGSGNILLQRILGELVNQHWMEPSAIEVLMADICANFDAQILASVYEVFWGLSSAQTVVTSYGLGFTNYSAQFPDGWVHLCDLRSRRHLYQDVFGTHQILTATTTAALGRMGVPIVLCLRHPLDASISVQHKAGEGQGQAVAVDEAELAANLARISNFMQRALVACDNPHIVRYEALLTRPAETIMSLAGRLGYRVSERAATAIWAQFALKPLSGAPLGHYRDPQVFGWRQVLPAGTMAQLVDPESAALFDRIGYGDSNGVLGSLDPHALAASTRGMSLKSCDPRVGRRLAGAAWLWSIHGRTGSMDRLAERMDAEPWRDLLGCGDYGLQKGQVVAEARI